MSKTVKKESSLSLEEIGLMCETLAVYLKSKKEADEKIKPLKEQVVAYANAHRDTMFKEGKTFKIAGVEISLKLDHTYALGEDFDLVKFYKRYPEAVKFSLSHTNMKNINAESFDIDHVQTEKIDVALEKIVVK
jgi:hypothetical protein